MPDTTPDKLYPELKLLRLTIEMSLQKNGFQNNYLGSAWRGILGWELKKLLCPYPRSPECPACILRENCPYYVLFEKKEDLPGIYDSPRGYILYAPKSAEDDFLILEITLLGYCTKYMPAVLKALARAQDKGLGRERIGFSIVSISEITPMRTYRFDIEGEILSQIRGPFPLKEWLACTVDSDSRFTIRFPTPLRLRQNGKYVADLKLSFMLATLAKRLEAVSRVFNGSKALGKKKWLELNSQFQRLDHLPAVSQEELSQKPGISKKIKWDDYSRFSNRQKRKVPMGGLVGECTFVSDLPGLGKWLKCAELLHVGKGAAMGLGRIERREDG